MKFLIPAITFFTALVSALPAGLDTRQNELDIFKLLPSDNAPAEISALSYVQWNATANTQLGWFNPDGEELQAFIQYNRREGIAFYSRNTRYEAYLAPTHGTPSYYFKLGNPEFEPTPALTLAGNWTITEGYQQKLYWGWNGNYENVWSACGSGTEYVLYFGTFSVPNSGCTTGFSLEVEYV